MSGSAGGTRSESAGTHAVTPLFLTDRISWTVAAVPSVSATTPATDGRSSITPGPEECS